jgi:hypothetical protein
LVTSGGCIDIIEPRDYASATTLGNDDKDAVSCTGMN